jgi:Uma2 family endonuclease
MITTSLNIPPTLEFKLRLSDEQFWQLCQDNDEWQFERTATGELIIMPPTGGTTSDRNADLIYQLSAWNRQNKLGKVFDDRGGFKLPNGANRSPDASLVSLERWNALTPEQQERFVPLRR